MKRPMKPKPTHRLHDLQQWMSWTGCVRHSDSRRFSAGWAPLDPLEDRILEHLRENFRRVSVERLVSGRGLLNIYEALEPGKSSETRGWEKKKDAVRAVEDAQRRFAERSAGTT